jgi:hypothetical protein
MVKNCDRIGVLGIDIGEKKEDKKKNRFHFTT